MRSKQFIFENPIFMEHKCRRSSLDGTPSLAKHLATDIKVREIHNRSINKLNIKKKKPIVLKIGSDRIDWSDLSNRQSIMVSVWFNQLDWN